MARSAVLNLPLDQVMRPHIALTLQHVLHLYTVGNFLAAWHEPQNKTTIEQVFDSPAQARHAASICAAWLGARSVVMVDPAIGWWNAEDRPAAGEAGRVYAS